MLQTAAIIRNPKRRQEATTASVPAPVGGWNDRDPIAAMDPADAVILDNFFPLPSKVIIRKGSAEWVTGIGFAVESLMGYKPQTGTPALFAAAGTSFYNASASGAIGPVGDPSFPSVSLLLHCDGVNGATTFTDSSSNVHTVTAGGTANTDTSDKKFGTASGKFQGIGVSTAYVHVATHASFVFGSGDFTLECWCKPDGTLAPASNVPFLAKTDGSHFAPWLFRYDGTNFKFFSSSAGASYDIANGTAIGTPTGGWDHIAVTRSGNTWSTYINGARTATFSSSSSVFALADDVYIGGSTAPNQGAGLWMDDVRITKGVARYTGASYTVPTAAFPNLTGSAVVTGLTNARWQHINMSNAGGNFLMAVNGSDKLRGWDGTTWWADGDGSHDITGVDTATCIHIALFKRRVWFVQKSTASAWYLPIDSIAGAASKLDLGPVFNRGGSLVAITNWSIDAGIGIDDYAGFISDQGEVAIYKGSDPSSATTWALVGTFWVGSPVGRRCTAQFGGDVLLISRDGLLPLSKALMSARVTTKIALTDKIQNATSYATTLYGSSFGWQCIQFPNENMILLNVPIGTGLQQQYVMNTISGAWCRFKGWPANCFELFGDELYFGGAGTVYKAWQAQADAGSNINAEALQAFNYFGERSTLKEWTLARPLVGIDNNTGFVFGINTDFDTTPPTGVPTFAASNAGTWDVALWNVGVWGGTPQVQKLWQSVNGFGYCAAMHIIAATNVGQIEWSATDYAYKRGGVL